MKKLQTFSSLVGLTWLMILAPCLLSSGCINMPKTMAAMAKDDSSSHISIKSIYVSIEWTRTNPHTNSLAHSLSPTGTIQVTKGK